LLQFKNKKQYCRTPNYKKLFKKPPLLVSKDFSLWVDNNDGVGFARLGVVISKKNVKMAVARNKFRRISKELFKSFQLKFITKDIVLVIKKTETTQNLHVWKKKLIEVYSWLDHFICGY